MQGAIPETHVASIEHAMALVGGIDALANRLGVAVDDITAWIRGIHTPSVLLLLSVYDVVIEETRQLSRVAMARGLAEMALAKAAAQARASHPE
jgi:regulator of protease activity HflC (stomatin/prohibitin superfamily)